jgi:hypothetical protein
MWSIASTEGCNYPRGIFWNGRPILLMEESDIKTMMSNITKLKLNQGRIRIGAVLKKKVKAFVYWVKEQERLGLDLDANQFTDVEVKETLGQMMVKTIEDESKLEMPSKLYLHKWVLWSEQLENYLLQVKGKNSTPLIFFI